MDIFIIAVFSVPLKRTAWVSAVVVLVLLSSISEPASACCDVKEKSVMSSQQEEGAIIYPTEPAEVDDRASVPSRSGVPDGVSKNSDKKPVNPTPVVNNDQIVFLDDDEEPRPTVDPPVTEGQANSTGSDLDDRVSFDGDKCPTGMKRFKNRCVVVD
jgi:hypothetical protein